MGGGLQLASSGVLDEEGGEWMSGQTMNTEDYLKQIRDRRLIKTDLMSKKSFQFKIFLRNKMTSDQW